MDGLVYRSAGITLNWHVPADQEAVREIQEIRYAWRCQHCGSSGSNFSLKRASECSECGATVQTAHIREFLEPAGFAVDFYSDPSNDISTQHFVPVEAPWVDAEGPWLPLENPDLGRFRCTSSGHLFNQSRGINGTGYAVCLQCGRAEPMKVDGTLPDTFSSPHRRLRRSKDEDLYCPGSNEPWKIKQGLTLGHEVWTDVLEFQLKNTSGIWLNDKNVATSLAVALRDSLAEAIGIQAQELGCDVKPVKVDGGNVCQSIVIFDRNSAGYSSSAGRYLSQILRASARQLNCPAACDSACPQCILDFDQRFLSERLDRIKALDFLSPNWLAMLSLPEEIRFLGHATRMEYRPITEALWLALQGSGAERVRFYLGGEEWDIGPSLLREVIYRLMASETAIEIVCPQQKLDNLEDVDRHFLFALLAHPAVSLFASEGAFRAGDGWVAAELMGSCPQVWAFPDEAAVSFGVGWGRADFVVTASVVGPDIAACRRVSANELQPSTAKDSDREIVVSNELDGPCTGFGGRFWDLLKEQHTGLKSLLQSEVETLVAFVYRDRYLFSPHSVALLGEVVDGLRQAG